MHTSQGATNVFHSTPLIQSKKRHYLSFCDALQKSCPISLNEQSLKLSNAGYPMHIDFSSGSHCTLISVVEALVKKLHISDQALPQDLSLLLHKFSMVPYTCGLSHILKRSVKVVFSTLKQLVNLYKMSFRQVQINANLDCAKKHKNPFVTCAENVSWIPLTCGKQYIGQTGSSINDRLREHACNVKNGRNGFWHCIAARVTAGQFFKKVSR